MNYYDIMKKRKHVRDYDMNIIPPKKHIEEILQKAYELTPSKQNAIPYEVSVLGPDKQDDKDKIYERVVGNHKFMEKYGLYPWQGERDRENPDYQHVRYNPYLLMISTRWVRKTNQHYQKEISKGHYMEQMDKERIKRGDDSNGVGMEVGLYTTNLTGLTVEKGWDISYCLCFHRNMKYWEEFDYVKFRPMLLVSIGKAKRYRGIIPGDTKPNIEDIVKWI